MGFGDLCESEFLLALPPTEEVGRDGEARALFAGRVSALSEVSLVVRGGWRETSRRKASKVSQLLSASRFKHLVGSKNR